MSVTAKLVLTDISPAMGSDPQGQPDQYMLSLRADYDNGANAEWAKATPSLSLSMTVKAEVAELFRKGAYQMELTPVDADEPVAIPVPADGTVAEGGEISGDGSGQTLPPVESTEPVTEPADTATPEAAPAKSKR
jgi:hypothetical protein